MNRNASTEPTKQQWDEFIDLALWQRELSAPPPPPPAPPTAPAAGDGGDQSPRHRRRPRAITVRLRVLVALVTPLLVAGFAAGWWVL